MQWLSWALRLSPFSSCQHTPSSSPSSLKWVTRVIYSSQGRWYPQGRWYANPSTVRVPQSRLRLHRDSCLAESPAGSLLWATLAHGPSLTSRGRWCTTPAHRPSRSSPLRALIPSTPTTSTRNSC
eukprot:857280-Rhodomonas_salina.1